MRQRTLRGVVRQLIGALLLVSLLACPGAATADDAPPWGRAVVRVVQSRLEELAALDAELAVHPELLDVGRQGMRRLDEHYDLPPVGVPTVP